MISGEWSSNGRHLVLQKCKSVIITKESYMKKMLRTPTTPGEILKEEFLVPMGTTQGELASHLDCDVKVINRIVNGRVGVSAEMALKLAAAFSTTPEFWLNAHRNRVQIGLVFKGVRALPKTDDQILSGA